MRLSAAWALGLLWAAAGVRAQGPQAAPEGSKAAALEALFLDFSKTQMGTVTSQEAKKKYLYTIQLEKSRLMHKLLRAVYENAYDLYRQGDFEGAKDLSQKILSMDPDFQDAAILHRASIELNGARRPRVSERRLVDNRFEEGLALYRQGRRVEASERWEEAVKLSPGNLKARYWLKKVRGELAQEHFRAGQKAYQEQRLGEALEQWYSALVLNPRYPRLVEAIAKVEGEIRRKEANEKLQAALNLYGQGKTEEALRALDEVLKVEPGEAKAQKLITEIRLEIGKQRVEEGRRLYASRRYRDAIAQWNQAVEYGYDPRRANALIARAKEQMQAESDARRRAAEEKARREEEERRREEEETKRKAEEEAKKKAQGVQEPEPEAAAGAGAEENRRTAIKHWNAGIIAYQKGDFARARDEWLLCRQFDPANANCQSGLQRIDQAYGGGP